MITLWDCADAVYFVFIGISFWNLTLSWLKLSRSPTHHPSFDMICKRLHSTHLGIYCSPKKSNTTGLYAYDIQVRISGDQCKTKRGWSAVGFAHAQFTKCVRAHAYAASRFAMVKGTTKETDYEAPYFYTLCYYTTRHVSSWLFSR